MKSSKSPFSRIAIILSALVIIILCILVVMNGTKAFGMLFLIPLGATIGTYMGITYPFSIAFKITYAIALLVSATAIITGLIKRRHLWGQLAVVAGVIGWCFVGLIGLGTGS